MFNQFQLAQIPFFWEVVLRGWVITEWNKLDVYEMLNVLSAKLGSAIARSFIISFYKDRENQTPCISTLYKNAYMAISGIGHICLYIWHVSLKGHIFFLLVVEP